MDFVLNGYNLVTVQSAYNLTQRNINVSAYLEVMRGFYGTFKILPVSRRIKVGMAN